MIRQCTVEMRDTKLIAKLSEGHKVSRDACYHHKCITGFTNLYRRFVNDSKKMEMINRKQKGCNEIAALEVLNYIDETLEASAVISHI